MHTATVVVCHEGYAGEQKYRNQAQEHGNGEQNSENTHQETTLLLPQYNQLLTITADNVTAGATESAVSIRSTNVNSRLIYFSNLKSCRCIREIRTEVPHRLSDQ
jgi:hypothetical protein